ncbi:hypothetical protein ATO8_08351 [Roseivivax marinus]|uniref:Tandem-95 repeat protein n=1 Tax=Roseivivax marinus TaxID=1379903 RepID=W4HLA3_9RHOB|nr:cadherin-like domain-containing protein [Roseivivax marinus]ETW13208.1 hypothetical protein ATO8_08351 [Roseivivax marinus]
MAFSDDFSGALLADGWSVEGPATISSGLGGDGTDAWFELTTSTQNHDIWNTNRAARVMQDVADEDFSLEARFLSTPTQRYQMQGYLVEQDAQNWLRFDTYSNGSTLYAFAAITENGSSRAAFSAAIPAGSAPYLRLERAGDTYTFSYSQDGATWTTAGSLTNAMTVTSAGVFAGSSGSAGSYTARIDYVESADDPIAAEDGVSAPPQPMDDALATPEDTALILTPADLLGNDSDPDGDPLTLISVGAPAQGTVTDNGDGTWTYQPATGYVGDDSFAYTVTDGTTEVDATVIVTVGTLPPPTFASDDFHAATLAPDWSVILPSGSSQGLAVEGADSVLTLTTGSGNHDIWNTNRAARAMQEMSDEDFALEARFLSTPSARYQMQGYVVEQDAQNWLRFDTYSDGNKLYAFAAITENGSSRAAFSVAIPEGAAPFLRLERVGDTYTFAYSQDGTTWTTAGSLTNAMAVSSAGVFAGSAGTAGSYTARIDYVESAADPIFTEDGISAPPEAVDDALATPEDTALILTAADLLGNDSDPDGDPLTLVSFGTPGHGTLTDNGDGTYTYQPAAGYTGMDAVSYTISDGTSEASATLVLTVGTPPPPAFLPDDFHDGVLGPEWTRITPDGTALAFATSGPDSVLVLSTREGNHDIWNTNQAARIMQEVSDEDFGLEARFLSTPFQRFQMQGFVVEQDAQNWLRFDTYSDGAALYAFAAITVNGKSSTAFRTTLPEGTAPFLRVERSGDTFTMLTSLDGETWREAGSFVHAMQVTQMGVFAGSTGGAMGHTVEVDYVQTDARPALTEDGITGPPAATDDDISTPADTAIELTAKDLTGNDSDPDGDTLTITGVTMPSNGTLVANGSGGFTYTPNAGYNGYDAFDYTVSDGTNTDTATVRLTVGTPPPPAFGSDDFHTDALDFGWTLTLPEGTSQGLGGDADDAFLTLQTGPGNYDLWGNTRNAATAMQVVGNTDMTLEARFLDQPTERHQMQGFLFEADETNWMRFDLYSDGSRLYAFAAVTEDGRTSTAIRTTIDEDTGYIRVERTGDVYTMFTSVDGVNWSSAGTATSSMEITAAGLFAGSVGTDAALTARVDYVESDADPISVEDDGYEPPATPPEPAPDLFKMDPGTVLAFTEADLTANDYDINRDPLSVVAMTDPANGTITDLGGGNYTYTPDPGFEGTDTFQYSVTDGGFVSTGSVTVLVDLFDAVSDDFSGGALDPAWRFEGIAGEARIGYEGNDAMALIVSPQGVQVSASNVMTTPRIVQDVLNLDFDISAGFLSTPTQQYQEHGLLVIEDEGNWLRFDLAFTGSTRTLIVGTIVDGQTEYPLFRATSATIEDLRIVREGDAFSFQYRGGGSDWIEAFTYERAMSVTEVGVFAGSTSFTGEVPGYIAEVDWFETVQEPITAEDGTYVPVNHAPVAQDVSIGVPETVTFDASDLLRTSYDPDLEDTLSLVSVGTVSEGTLVDNGDGTFTYTPTPGFDGIATLDFTVTDGALQSSATATLDARDPIDIWYGDTQSFGTPGEGQRWINILGAVAPNVVDLGYRLNGGPVRELSIGPDTRRLQEAGDFNIDIDYAELDGSAADDIVTIVATIDTGAVFERDVTVDYVAGDGWDKTYAIDWETVTDIQEVVQVADGTWSWDANGVRPVDLGYDRLLVLGDQGWDNYELNLTITPNDLTNVDPNGRDGGAFAIGMLWDGHTEERFFDWQPATNYEPGAGFFYTGRFKSHSYHSFSEVLGIDGMTVQEDTTYNVTVRVEQGDLYDRVYSMKVWEAGTPEPVDWTLKTYESFSIDEAPATGSIYLNAHYYDVTFGDLSVTEITGDDIIQGDATDELLLAVDPLSASPGQGETDVFVGGGGADEFVLGQDGTVFYDDGVATSDGRADYAFVWDFEAGTDVVRLAGTAADYRLSVDEAGLPAGTAIWHIGAAGESDELIGVLNAVYDLTLDDENFAYDALFV